MLKRKFLHQMLNQNGQLTIFFGITLLVLITVIAVVINVGILVKAKINLQNAVDAAAFSGASVQARQLTDIAYLNWEMRNTYKEWMFKYYVIGQMGNPLVREIARSGGSDRMDFRLRPFVIATSTPNVDNWNIPTICMKFAQERSNICQFFTQPGLPRTASLGTVGVDETFNTTVNELTRIKAQGCVERSKINMQTAIQWAYGTGNPASIALNGLSQVAANRPGAWTEAMLTAFRIRNLEFMVNRPPQTVCRGGANCPQNISTLEQGSGEIPLFERTIKAFWSAYRNLGNSDSRGANEMKESFRLTELVPSEENPPQQNSLSTALYVENYPKPYLDLQLVLANLVTFFSNFVPLSSESNGVTQQAECALSKIGLPIPNYPLGFIKNPNILTYYAVKGEADFQGMFTPFNIPITLKAYAAAKPFGGRIGPQLFRANGSETGMLPRPLRSFPFIASVKTTNTGTPIGKPIPADEDFWVSNNDDTIGGLPQISTEDAIKFAIPNLIYDIPDDDRFLTNQEGAVPLQEISLNLRQPPPPGLSGAPTTDERGGLYDRKQYLALEKSAPKLQVSNELSTEDLDAALRAARRPTRYDALNYLIPTWDRGATSGNTKVAGTEAENVYPVKQKLDNNNKLAYEIYAPLFGTGLLYNSQEDIFSSVEDSIKASEPAIEKIVDALFQTSQFVRNEDATKALSLLNDAANALHNAPSDSQNPTCPSLAGQFKFFFTATNPSPSEVASCGFEPVKLTFNNFVQEQFLLSASFSTRALFSIPTEIDDIPPNFQIKSAFSPGPEQGNQNSGTPLYTNPFLPQNPPIDMHRNFYSTKFIGLETLKKNSLRTYVGGRMATYSEGSTASPQDLARPIFGNPLSEDIFTDLDPLGLGIFY